MDAPPPRSSRRFVIRVRRPPGGFPPLSPSWDGSDECWAEAAAPTASNRVAYGGKGPPVPKTAMESNGATYGGKGEQSEEAEALANASRPVWLRLRGVKAGYSAAAAGHYGPPGSSRPGSNPTSLGPSRAASPLSFDGGLTSEGANRKRSFDETANGLESVAPMHGGGGPSLLQQAKTSRLVTQLVETLARPLVHRAVRPPWLSPKALAASSGGSGPPGSARRPPPGQLGGRALNPSPHPPPSTDRRARRGGRLRQGERA